MDHKWAAFSWQNKVGGKVYYEGTGNAKRISESMKNVSNLFPKKKTFF